MASYNPPLSLPKSLGRLVDGLSQGGIRSRGNRSAATKYIVLLHLHTVQTPITASKGGTSRCVVLVVKLKENAVLAWALLRLVGPAEGGRETQNSTAIRPSKRESS